MGENTRIGWGRIPGWDGGEYQDRMGENTRMGWRRIPGWAKIFVRHVFMDFLQIYIEDFISGKIPN